MAAKKPAAKKAPTTKATTPPTKPVVPFGDDSETWEPVKGDFGNTFDPVNDGPFVGRYVGLRRVDVDDPNSPDKDATRENTVHDFVDAAGEAWSIWGSFDLDSKLLDKETHEPRFVGKLVRIEFDEIRPLKGGRTLKTFKVAVK